MFSVLTMTALTFSILLFSFKCHHSPRAAATKCRKATERYPLTGLEDRCWDSRCGPGCDPSGGSRGASFHTSYSFWGLLSILGLRLHLHPLLPSSPGLLRWVCLSLFLLFLQGHQSCCVRDLPTPTGLHLSLYLNGIFKDPISK